MNINHLILREAHNLCSSAQFEVFKCKCPMLTPSGGLNLTHIHTIDKRIQTHRLSLARTFRPKKNVYILFVWVLWSVVDE